MEDNKSLDNLKETLTKKNFKFIELLASGLSVVEAYKAAGYTGTNEQQPYQLSHSLKHKISEYLQNKGFNKENLAIELGKLLSLPLRPDQTNVTVDQKIKLLRLFKDALPESEKKEEPKFTRFTVVNNYVTNMDNASDKATQVIEAVDQSPSDSEAEQ